MKKILIILANYCPNPSSVSNCMKPFIKKMSETYHIDIITNKKNFNVPDYEVNEKVNIYRIDDIRAINTFYLNELNKINSSFFLKLITKFFTFLLKSFYYLRYVIFAKEKVTGGWEINRVCKKCFKLDKIFNYDFVISVSLPFVSHYIAEKIKDYKGENIKWIVLEFDPYSFNKNIKSCSMRRKKMYKDEIRILKKCDGLCLTPELYEFYKNKNFIPYLNKVNILPYANFEKIEYDNKLVACNFMKRNKINCLYTGQLYDDIRNPSTLLKVFSKLNDNVQLYLMTNFTNEKIKKYSPQNYMPFVISLQNRDTALYNIMQANILVNIGNTVELQTPGKIFEYMSTGKPIIHFSKIKNDPAVKYLKCYPLVFIVNEWEIDYISKQLEEFCNKNKNKQLTFDEVKESLGEYSSSVIINKFINILNSMH